MSVSPRQRFEILKRDGFKCRYCGATAAQSMLHVDHVVARAEGGTDDPANLVASCSDCNLGKSNKPLGALDPKLAGAGSAPEAMLEHAEQVRAYLDAVHEVEVAREQTVKWLAAEWSRRIGYEPPRNVGQMLRAALLAHPIERILRALDATGGAADRLTKNIQVITYWRACMKNMRDEEILVAPDTLLLASAAARVLSPHDMTDALQRVREDVARYADLYEPGTEDAARVRATVDAVDDAIGWANGR